jgi:hypothetical protein
MRTFTMVVLDKRRADQARPFSEERAGACAGPFCFQPTNGVGGPRERAAVSGRLAGVRAGGVSRQATVATSVAAGGVGRATCWNGFSPWTW